MDRLDHIARFAAEAEAATDLETLRNGLIEHLERLGLAWFAYEADIPAGDVVHKIVINNYPPDWIDHYVGENYGAEDAVLIHSTSQVRPFVWSDAIGTMPLTNRQRRLFREAREADLCSGGVIPLYGPGKIKGTFAVASALDDEAFAALFAERRYELQLLANYFHSHVVDGKIVDVPMHTINPSPRVRQVLTHIALGRERGEIATAMKIQESTVKDHIKRATETFRAKNKTHAAVLACAMGLIQI